MPEENYSIMIRRVPRSRSIRLRIARINEVRISAPKSVSKREIMSFVEKEKPWIQSQMNTLRSRNHLMSMEHSGPTRLRLTRQARTIAQYKCEYFGKKYGFVYNRIAIRNQISRWGSCSSHGNLNFNYRIALLPDELIDYLVVHELCHLREMNHSERFWKLVEQEIPDYKKRARALKTFSITS